MRKWVNMNGMELSRDYYTKAVKPLLEETSCFEKLTVGLVGEGSECAGFDDAISKDHDFAPRVCIWLSRRDYESQKDALNKLLIQAKYDYARDCGAFELSRELENRSNLLVTERFYKRYTGKSGGPENWREWIAIPSEYLFVATNGEIFLEGDTDFMRIRKHLKGFYPEDVRIKKIVAAVGRLSQAGQYNYRRVHQRGDDVACFRTVNVFLENFFAAMFLLRRRYMPFYKWTYRAFSDLDNVCKYEKNIKILVSGDGAHNEITENAMEGLCGLLLDELQQEGLTQRKDSFLMNHLHHISGLIENKEIRSLPLLYG